MFPGADFLINLIVHLLPWLFSGESSQTVKVIAGINGLDRASLAGVSIEELSRL